MFYTTIRCSFNHGLYIIDNIEDHYELLYRISTGVCKLNKEAVPERFEDYFKPYMIESSEFEFCYLEPSSKKMEKIEARKRANNKVLRLLDNVKLAPVRNVVQDVLFRMRAMVFAAKGYVDFFYLLYKEHTRRLFLDLVPVLGQQTSAGAVFLCMIV